MAVKTISDNTEGNKYHDEAGQFTSPESGTAKPESDNFGDFGGLGTFELKKEVKEEDKPRLNLPPGALQAFLAKKKEKQIAEAKTFLESTKVELDAQSLEYLSKYESLTPEERNSLLENSPLGYDKKKLKNLSLEEQQALMCAQDILSKEKSINNEINLLEKEKEKINTEMATEVASSELNQQQFTGLWMGTVYPSDYAAKSKIDPYLNSSAIDRKREYFQSVLQNSAVSLTEKAKATQALKQLDKFEEAGKAFEELKLATQAKYIEKVEGIESKLTELNQSKEKYAMNSPLFVAANQFCEKYQDKNAAYSQHRKDKATWIDSKWIKAHPEYKDMGIEEASTQYFGQQFEKMWDEMSSSERTALKEYTSAYSRINEPLRSLYYSGQYSSWNASKFANAVNNMSNAIEKCVWNEDIWVQRGVGASTNMFTLPGSSVKKSIMSIPDSQLDSLVGLTFTDNGFYSSGAGKGTGFASNNLIINTYCPKGTKMAYMNTKGNYNHSSENEMILQRGYSYRITKVEHKGSRYYMDVEVILGSDSQKLTGQALVEQGAKYIN